MSNVIQLSDYRKTKDTPLFISHLDGTIKTSPHFKRPTSDDFGDRIQKIRTSLDRINTLMADLRKQNRKKERFDGPF